MQWYISYGNKLLYLFHYHPTTSQYIFFHSFYFYSFSNAIMYNSYVTTTVSCNATLMCVIMVSMVTNCTSHTHPSFSERMTYLAIVTHIIIYLNHNHTVIITTICLLYKEIWQSHDLTIAKYLKPFLNQYLCNSVTKPIHYLNFAINSTWFWYCIILKH